jgi:hypothetical protein
MFGTFEAVRAEALFVWSLQSTERPLAAEVPDVVTATLRRLGMRGCAALVATEFGDYPETAVSRMSWALATVRAVYPKRANPYPAQQPLRLAS